MDITIEINKGDIILLYADGIIEALDSNNDFFTEERLADILKRYSQESPELIQYAVLQELEHFKIDDDITLVTALKSSLL